MSRSLLALALVVALAGWTTAQAPNPDEKPSKQAEDIDLLSQASQLAEVGKRLKSPEAYIAAGSLFLQLEARTRAGGGLGKLAAKAELLDDKDQPVAGGKVEDKATPTLKEMAEDAYEAASLLGVELKISQQVEALVKASKGRSYETGARGAIGGPQGVTRVLGPGETHQYKIAFDTQSTAAIGYQSNAGPIGVRLHGPNGNQLMSAREVAGRYVWSPVRNEPIKTFTVRVHNPGKGPVIYRLFTN